MKALILFFCLTVISVAHADNHVLPPSEINETTLGGTVLLLKMKYSLVISGADNLKIRNELGENGRQEFFKGMITNRKPQDLKRIYGREDRPATNASIARYETLILDTKVLSRN